MRDSKRWTWRHTRYRTRSVLDHVPSGQMRLISRCFVPSDFSISADHRPVICELNFRLRLSKRAPPKPILDIRSLSQPETRHAFQKDISDELSDSNPEKIPIEELSSNIWSTVIASAQFKTAKTKQKFPKEFSKMTIELITKKRNLWKFLKTLGKEF